MTARGTERSFAEGERAPAVAVGRRAHSPGRWVRSALLAAAVVAPPAAGAPPSPGDAAAATIRFLEARVQGDPGDFLAQNRLAGLYFRKLRETGDLAYLDRATQAAEASLAAVPAAAHNAGGLALLALARFESHRFGEAVRLAEQAYAEDPRLAAALLTIGDAQLELGDYDRAAASYGRILKESGSPPVLSRRARLSEIHGDAAQAIELLSRAAGDALRQGSDPAEVAWYHVRLGEIQLRTGHEALAEAECLRALELDPESYSALEHLAELRGAQARFDESFALYRKLVERVPRPEILQALGDLLAFQGKAAEAKPWYDRAESAYLKSVAHGHVYYFHHLASFYADSRENPAEALRWARKDLELRRSVFARDALAWALLENGELEEAARVTRQVLAVAPKDAHVLYHAGMILSQAGQVAEGAALLRRALEVNPLYRSFHVHR